MIKVSALLKLFERMLAEKWPYELGAAREGCVDCSGAFAYAFKTLGGISIAHGSNTIYRQSIGAATSQPMPGYAAFKIRRDAGEPKKYFGDGIGNVYHMGLVSADGKHVLNAKGAAYGFCLDDLKGWTCFAPLLDVDYTREVVNKTALFQAVVNTDSGNLNVREGMSTASAKVTSLPKGTTVDVIFDGGEWYGVQVNGIGGYAKAEYLKRVDAPAEPVQDAVTTTTITDGTNVLTLCGVWRVAED